MAAVAAEDSQRLLTGDGYVELLGVALQAIALNPDRLLNLKTEDPMDNILAQVMTGVLTAAADNFQKKDSRHLLWGDVLLQATEIAYSNSRGEIWYADLAGGKATRVDVNPFGSFNLTGGEGMPVSWSHSRRYATDSRVAASRAITRRFS